MATGKTLKNPKFNSSYLKNELSDPQFLLHKSDQQAKTKLPAKLQNNSVTRIQSYLIL